MKIFLYSKVAQQRGGITFCVPPVHIGKFGFQMGSL
jgi:hypothetical protein